MHVRLVKGRRVDLRGIVLVDVPAREDRACKDKHNEDSASSERHEPDHRAEEEELEAEEWERVRVTGCSNIGLWDREIVGCYKSRTIRSWK